MTNHWSLKERSLNTNHAQRNQKLSTLPNNTQQLVEVGAKSAKFTGITVWQCLIDSPPLNRHKPATENDGRMGLVFKES